MASTRRAALLAAPALIAASAAPGAEEPSPVIRLAAEAIAAEKRAAALWAMCGDDFEAEKALKPERLAATRTAEALFERLLALPGKSFADVVAKAKAAYFVADKDAGTMVYEDDRHGLLISICEDVLALAGQPVPR